MFRDLREFNGHCSVRETHRPKQRTLHERFKALSNAREQEDKTKQRSSGPDEQYGEKEALQKWKISELRNARRRKSRRDWKMSFRNEV